MAGPIDDNQKQVIEEAVQQFVDEQLQGRQPDIDEFVKQYPEFEDQIRKRIGKLRKLDTLFSSLVQVDENDFDAPVIESDLAGRKIGSFEIGEMIGRGGMGVVYLARDTKLDRSVAIKSMPAELQANSTAQMRFKREAKLLASLNHPNIAVIHDIIEQDAGSGYLVLEYIPGQTLTERIAHKPLKLDDALSIGGQIAEALLGAYENGVTHRDLKPSNIKITPEGRVKVLDFGLAKAYETQDEKADITITQPGRIVGTPAYMSPEQARGTPTDHRTDIWSFGCIMYEMLTGQLPFEGETATDTVARVLERQPDWQALPQKTPVNIRVLLRRCLEKNARQRLQHIGDAVIEINETLNVPAIAPPLGTSIAERSRSERWKSRAIYCVAGLIIGAIVVGIALRSSAPPPEQGLHPTQRSVISLPEGQTLALSRSTPLGIAQPAVALSPDGLRVVYVADIDGTTQLFERLMNQFEVKPIPATEGAFAPFFSRDGQSVGFFTKEKLKIVSLLGGEPVTICDARNPRGASWGADGMIYFAETEGSRLSRVPAAGGTKEHLMARAEPPGGEMFSYGYPVLLPGGKQMLVSSPTSIMLFSLETKEKKILIEDGQHARYIPTGHLVYARAGAIEAIPFSLRTLQVSGPSVPILERVMLDSRHGTAQFIFSSGGLLVYVPGGDTVKSIPVWIDRQGNVEPLPMPAQKYGTFHLSPDGKQLAIQVYSRPQSNVYIFDIVSGRGTRLTQEGSNVEPIWTPDGKRVTFFSGRQGLGKHNLLWKPVDGSGKTELLHSSDYGFSASSWSSDGKLLAFYQIHPTRGYDIWVLSLEGDREPELIVGTEFSEMFPAFSPDGHWIAYVSDKDGKFQVYVQPYPAMDRVWQISDDFGEEPIWSSDGNELFYRNGDKWMVVSISTEPEFKAGTPQLLFEGLYSNVPGMSYDVVPDGQRFLVLQPEYDDSQVRELHVVTNWFEELKRIVPSTEAP
ncbi:protein kinase [Planctomycetota bacterium]